jgi:hypothetical protein
MALLAVLAAGLARLVVSSLHSEVRSQAGLRALNLARSAAAQAVAEVLAEETFGVDGAVEATVTVSDERGEAWVTFSPLRAAALGIPYSTNNLDSTVSMEGSEAQTVPAGTLRLLAVGRSGGVDRRLEAVIEIPKFPWAIASGGPVRTDHGILIGSLPEGVWPPDLDQLLPADILSNDSGAQAVSLGQRTTVLGDVETAGQVVYTDPSVSVAGVVSEQIEPVDIPTLRSQDYDPLLLGLTSESLDDLVPGPEAFRLTGAARRTGALNLPGGLILDRANLFVDGDLTVGGTLEGEGVVVVTGNLIVSNYANLVGATNLALLADGQIRLGGQHPGQSKFRGIVYAGGGIEASKMTLVGSLVSAGTGGGISLSDMVVVAEKAKTQELAKEFFIGTLDPNDDRYHDESVGDTEPPSGSLLRIKISKTPGADYPIEVEFQYRENPPYHYTISGPDEVADVQEQLEWLVDDWTQVPRDAWVETIFDRYPLNGFTEQLGPQEQGENFQTDLSLLIPAKDRIRVISWFER